LKLHPEDLKFVTWYSYPIIWGSLSWLGLMYENVAELIDFPIRRMVHCHHEPDRGIRLFPTPYISASLTLALQLEPF
jgi:hypothetical protein